MRGHVTVRLADTASAITKGYGTCLRGRPAFTVDSPTATAGYTGGAPVVR